MTLTLLYGITYTGLQIFFSEQISNVMSSIGFKSSSTFILSALGVIGLQTFWTRYVPADLNYKKKSFVTPLIIALLIFIPLIYIIVT